MTGFVPESPIFSNLQFFRLLGTKPSAWGFQNYFKPRLAGVLRTRRVAYPRKTPEEWLPRGSWRIFSDASVTIVHWRRARDLRKLGHLQVPGSIPAETRQLNLIWIWANRPSSKGFKLLFPVKKANTNKPQGPRRKNLAGWFLEKNIPLGTALKFSHRRRQLLVKAWRRNVWRPVHIRESFGQRLDAV